MHLRSLLALTTMALLAGSAVVAQQPQKQQVSFKVSATDTKYGQQMNIEVGDRPDHLVRVFEFHRVLSEPVMINGIKLKETWNRGIVNITDGNGSGIAYTVYMMDNGDKIFARTDNAIENVAGDRTAFGSGVITGGTGKFSGIQGIVRTRVHFDFTKGFNESQDTLEYLLK